MYKFFFIIFFYQSTFLFSSENKLDHFYPLKYSENNFNGYVTKLFLTNSENSQCFNFYGFLDEKFVDLENDFSIKKNDENLKISFPPFFNLFFDENMEAFKMIALNKNNSESMQFNNCFFSEKNGGKEDYKNLFELSLSDNVIFLEEKNSATQIFNVMDQNLSAAILLNDELFLIEKLLENNKMELVKEKFENIPMFNNYIFKKYNDKIYNIVKVDFLVNNNINFFFEGTKNIGKEYLNFSIFGIDLNSNFPLSKSVTTESNLLFEYNYNNGERDEFTLSVDYNYNSKNASGKFFNILKSKLIEINFGKIISNELGVKKVNIFPNYLMSDFSSMKINIINNFPYKLPDGESPLITKIMDKNELLLQNNEISSLGVYFSKPNYLISFNERDRKEYKLIEVCFNYPKKEIKSQNFYAEIYTEFENKFENLKTCICEKINNSDYVIKEYKKFYKIKFEIKNSNEENYFSYDDSLSNFLKNYDYFQTEVNPTFLRTTYSVYDKAKCQSIFENSTKKITSKIFNSNGIEFIRNSNNLFVLNDNKKCNQEMSNIFIPENIYNLEKQNKKIDQIYEIIKISEIENNKKIQELTNSQNKSKNEIKDNNEILRRILATVTKKE